MKNSANSPVFKTSDLVPEAASFVYNLYKEKLPESLTYHTYQHAVEVAGAVNKIGGKTDLNPNEIALVSLAAWFHDTGYLEDYCQHLDNSIRIATDYLQSKGVPSAEISDVEGLIRFIHSGRDPESELEQILNDANLVHAGSKNFQERSTNLRLEWERAQNCTLSDAEWAERQLQFLTGVRYTTAHARKKYEKRRIKNLRAVHQTLALTLGSANLPEAPPEAKEVPTRGIETMFRNIYRTHIDLSAIADSKANIMISVNAILMSIIISYVSTRLQTDPWLIVPSASLLVSCLVAIVFAILSARPKVSNRAYSLSEIRKSRANILFFGNFANMPLDDFRLGIRELMLDADALYDNMITDLHSLGAVLQKKYHLLWISYSVFMTGLILSVVLFGVFFYLA
jgi:predicted metal-dependent HD superfamily phosphohydrolase